MTSSGFYVFKASAVRPAFDGTYRHTEVLGGLRAGHGVFRICQVASVVDLVVFCLTGVSKRLYRSS